MKKKLLGGALCAFLLFNMVGTDFVSLAEDIEPTISNETLADDFEESEEEVLEDVEVVASEDSDEETEVADELLENGEEDLVEEESSEELLEEKKEVSFSQGKIVGGVQINLEAAAGVLPENAYFKAVEIADSSKLSSIKSAVGDELSNSQKVVGVKAFDITIYDKDDNEIQPDTSKGNVKVTFSNVDTSSKVEVFHVSDACDSAEEVSSSVSGSQVSIEAEHFSTYVITYVDKTTNETKEIADLVDVTVTSNGKAVSDKSEISKDTVFRVEYAFNKFNVEMNDDELPSLKTDVEYTLPGFNVAGFDLKAKEYSITADVDGQKDVKIGTLILSVESGKAKLTLRLSPDLGSGTMENAKAYFELKLEADPNKSETKTLNLPDGNTYTFTIKEYQTTPPTLTFKGVESGTDSALWTATITNGDTPKQYDDGYTFSVVLSEDEEYVDGTFKLGDSDVTPSWDASKRTLSYNIQSPSYTEKGTTNITYKTKASFKLQQNVIYNNEAKITSTLTNKAKLVDNKTASDITEEKSATVTQDKTLEHWLEKVPGKITKDGKIEWTITVKNNGYTLKNVTVYDKFLVEDGTMSLVGKVKVGDAEVDVTAGTSSDNFNWKYNLGTLSGTDTRVFKYTTQIDNYSEYLKHNHTKKPTNTAWLTYEYDGFGAGTIEGPSLEKTAEVNLKAGIQITAEKFEAKTTAYDPATHRLNWKVEANREYQDLKNVVITVAIPEGQGYVSGTISEVTYYNSDGTVAKTETVTPTYDKNNNKVILPTISDIEKKKVSFTLQTELDDTQREIWSTNKDGTAKNNAILQADNINQSTDTASITYVSDVLKTSISNYNYNDHTVDVTVKVDGNKMAMKDTLLTNKLHYDDYDLEVIEDTLKVNGTSVTAQYNTEENLVVNLGDIATNAADAVKTVTFKAKVKSDNYTKVNNSTFGINNKAILVTEDIKAISTQNVTETSNKITINNSVLIKTGLASKETGEAAYSVYINKAKNPIPANTVVTDILGTSLELDASSVKLYECEISDADGSVLSETEVSCDKTVSTTADGKTKLDVKLPATVGNNIKAYKLSYTAMLTDTALKDCTNSIAMSFGATAIGSMSMNAYANFGAVGEFTKAAYIDIKAVNKEGKPIGGVTYQVVDGDGKVYASTTTKADGTASIRTGKLTAGKNYILKPVNVPAGYEDVPEQTLNNVKLGKAGLQSKEFEYEKKTASIKIYTRVDNEDGELLEGAKVKVTKDGAAFKEWKSDSSNNPTELKLPWGDSTYVVTNTSAPNDYHKDSNTLTFKVVLKDDGTVVVEKVDPVNGNTVITKSDVVCKTKNTATFKVDNVSSELKNPIEGTTIVVSTKETPTAESIITTIHTDGTTKEVTLPEGEYFLVDTQSPKGFTTATTKKIRVNADQTVDLFDGLTGNYEPLDENTSVVVENDYSSEKKVVTFDPEEMGINPNMFKSMKFALYRVDKLTGTRKLVTPYTSSTDTKLVYNLNYQDEYVFEPETTLSGYNPVEPITIKAVAKDVYDDAGNVTGAVDSVFKKSLKDSTFSEVTNMDEIGELVKPSLAPVYYSSSSSDSSSSGGYYNPNALALRENAINALADNNNATATASGARLAKTGGFVGTLPGYLVALLLVALGVFLVFGKEKRVK